MINDLYKWFEKFFVKEKQQDLLSNNKAAQEKLEDVGRCQAMIKVTSNGEPIQSRCSRRGYHWNSKVLKNLCTQHNMIANRNN